MIADLIREARLIGRDRRALLAVLALALFAAASLALGLATVARERAAIDRIVALQQADVEAVMRHAGDAGSAAYYTFHPTWDAPSDLAFAALGGRDIAPALLRIRALALEGQIYENEAANPELALPGRFDFAFVVVYLAPLVIFALLHDLRSGESEAGRLGLLRAQPGARRRIWGPRIALRLALVLAALLLPFAVAALCAGTAPARAFGFAGLVGLACLFWGLVAVIVGRIGLRSSVNAASLGAIWFAATLIVPATANIAINSAITVPDGAALARENREAVHAGWDKPRGETMARFLALYPAYRGTPPVGAAFHWKWYFAFQHLGDVQVMDAARAYRDGIARRERAARLLGWLLPPLGVQQALHDLAGTGVAGQLGYQDRVRAYHRQLREFYYPYLFFDRPFGPADFARAPRFR